MNDITARLIEFKEQIRFYHWQTKSFARHKATGKFLEIIEEKTDDLVETLMGARGKRVDAKSQITFDNYNDKTIISYINSFISFLKNDLPKHVEKKDTDILNIRDEILGSVNRMLFLFTLQ